MDLNKIKSFGKAELLQKLTQSGFIEVVNILEDKEINGLQLINLKEFEIFKWKLSKPQKKCLWDCIAEIKTKPHVLLRRENQKSVKTNSLPRRSSSVSESVEATNLLKGKLECLLGPAGARIGSASTLPNKHTTHFNDNKTVEDTYSRNKPPAPPPACIRSTANQSGAHNTQGQRVVKKPALPLPHEINNKYKGVRDARNPQTSRYPKSNSPDITEMYMDMQPPTNTKQTAEDDADYLTPNDVSRAAPNFKNFKSPLKNSSISKNNIEKSTRVPPPPPLPNKNTNPTKNNNFKEHKSWSNVGKKIPKLENPEENTVDPPPKFGNAINAHNHSMDSKENHNDHNTRNRKLQIHAGANSNLITTSKFFVEVVTDETEEESNYEIVNNEENGAQKKFKDTKGYMQFPNDDESDDTYETPPALKSRVPNKYTGRIENELTNTHRNFSNISESRLEADSMNAKKPAIKELENVLTNNARISTQEPVLTKITSTLSSIFRVKRSRNFYENHSIISEIGEDAFLPVNNRPLPKTPTETAKHNTRESKPVRGPFSNPIPPPRDIVSVSDSQDGGYVKLIKNVNKSNEFPHSFPPKQPLEFEEEQTYINVTEAVKESNGSDNKVEEELVDYGNITNHNEQTPQISLQDKLALLLAEQLKQRNLINNEVESTHVESDFEDEDDDQPVYGNAPTSVTNATASPEKHNLTAHSSHIFKSNSPTHISKSNNESDDDLDQPVYDNTPMPTSQRKYNVSPNPLLSENKSSIHNLSKIDKESDDDNDQPIYDNTPTSTNQRKQNLSPNPLSFENKSAIRNPSRVDQENHNNHRGPSYIHIDEPFNPPISNQINNKLPRPQESFGNIPPINYLLPNQRKANVPKNAYSFGGKSSSSTSINSNVSDENSDDASSHSIKNRLSIQKRPLPEIPTRFVTPPSSNKSTPAFRGPPPVISTKILNHKPKKLDKKIASLPKPPIASTTRLNYEHVLVNLPSEQHSEEEITVKEEIEDGSIFNINDEPYFRNTDRKGAKLLLRNLEDGAFLFRPSQVHFLVLTVKHNGKFYNLGIERSSNNKIRLSAEGDNKAPSFATLRHFVNHFTEEAVTFVDKKTVVEIHLKPILPSNLF